MKGLEAITRAAWLRKSHERGHGKVKFRRKKKKICSKNKGPRSKEMLRHPE